MDKEAIIREVSKRTGFTQPVIRLFFEDFIDTIRKPLSKGERVMLQGIGVIKIKTKRAYMFKNPRTLKMTKIPRRCRIRFEPSKEIREL